MKRSPAAVKLRERDNIWTLSRQVWKTVLIQTWREQSEDNVGLIAAGVAFYGFLALVPILGALVLSYGIVASPDTVLRNVQHLTSVMPGSAAKLVGEQLLHVADGSSGKKGAGLALALAIALFGARNGAGSILTALNIAYEVDERRSLITVNLLAVAMTIGSLILAVFAAAAIAALGHIEDLVSARSGIALLLGQVITYVLLMGAGAAASATLYRFGPSGRGSRWQWLTPGSALCAVGWLLLTLGFGLYVAAFAHYDATYGSLGAVIVLLTWLYLSSYVFLLGAELNSELDKLVSAVPDREHC